MRRKVYTIAAKEAEWAKSKVIEAKAVLEAVELMIANGVKEIPLFTTAE